MLTEVTDKLDLLRHIITGDKMWVCGHDSETKAQSSQWKILLNIFLDYSGIVYCEFLLSGYIVNKEYYVKSYVCLLYTSRCV